jgi:transposase
MLSLPQSIDVFICTQPTDMRKSFDTLASLTRDILKQDPLSGKLFVFFNRNRNRTKVLYWDKDGYCILLKRLEKGRFHLYDWDNSSHNSYVTDPKELGLILDGVDLSRAKKHTRFELDTNT